MSQGKKYLSKLQSNTQGVSDKADENPPEEITDDEEDGSSDEVISDDKEREIQLMQKIAAWRAMFWKANSNTEIKILKHLKHENIVEYVESFKTKNGKICIIMELCDMGTLESIIVSRMLSKKT